jgi:hypothetical protein
MPEDELRVLIGNDDTCYVVSKETFERLATPLVEKAEQYAPPNLRSYVKALEDAGYTVMKKEIAKQLFLAHQTLTALNQANKSK